ncbi:MAG: hypothetical protein ACYC46_10820 [Acidobacteriaceae bacterium]
MKSTLSLLGTTVLCGLLAACGSGGSGTNISGNWSFTANSTASPNNGPITITAALNSHSGQVVGILHFFGTSCIASATDVAATGTLSSTGAVKLTTSSTSNQVITITATASKDGGSITGGTYTVSGGCADSDAGNVSGVRIATLTGTFAGNVQIQSGPGLILNTQLTQSPTADTDGFFDLTGTIKVQGSSCFTSGKTEGSPGGILFGTRLVTIYTLDDGSTLTLDATTNTGGTSLASYAYITNGKCNGTGSGTLTKQ